MKPLRTISLVLPILATGCASLFGDSSDQISIHSNEPGAKIFVNGNQVGTGSATYSVPAGKTAILTATKKGCSDMSIPTEQSIRGITFLDIFLWPTFIVDAATGDMHKTDPTDYTVTPNCNK